MTLGKKHKEKGDHMFVKMVANSPSVAPPIEAD
jgi:hypothetical protein